MKTGCTLARLMVLFAALATGLVAHAGTMRDCERPNHYILSLCEDELRLEWVPVPDSLLAHGQGHAATLLADGRVLVVGGISHRHDEVTGRQRMVAVGAEIYDPVTRSWSLTAPMNVPRSQGVHATRLLDGRVLVLGGEWLTRHLEPTNEIFDPATGTWTRAANLATPRSGFTATALANGEVLLTGGVARGIDAVAVAEIYNPESDTWRTTGRLREARWGHTAKLLPDGKVLVVGGALDDWLTPPAETGELFDPQTETWHQAGHIAQGWSHTMTSFGADWVLVAGGYRDDEYVASSLASTRIYDWHSGYWTDTGSLISPRHGHLAMPIAGRGVLIVGGQFGSWTPFFRSVPVERLELFDLLTWTWNEVAAVNELPTSAANYHSATPLADGTVLLIGDVQGKRAVQLRY